MKRKPTYHQNNYSHTKKHPAPATEQSSTIPYDIEQQIANSHTQYEAESVPQEYTYPSYIKQSHQSRYPQNHSHNKPFIKHQQSYTDVLEDALNQETAMNIEHMIFQNNQIIQTLNKDNQRLQLHLDNLRRLFQLKKFKHPQSSPHTQNTTKAEHSKPKKTTYEPVSAKRQHHEPKHHEPKHTKTSEQIKTELKNKIKTQKIHPSFKGAKSSSNEIQPEIQSEKYPFKGSINYTSENWAIQQNYVMRFLHLWLKENVQRVDDQKMVIDKKIILGCYENWRNLQKFQIQTDLPPGQVQQILTIQVKAYFKCSCNMKGFAGLEFTKEEFKKFGNEQKEEESLEIEQENDKRTG